MENFDNPKSVMELTPSQFRDLSVTLAEREENMNTLLVTTDLALADGIKEKLSNKNMADICTFGTEPEDIKARYREIAQEIANNVAIKQEMVIDGWFQKIFTEDSLTGIHNYRAIHNIQQELDVDRLMTNRFNHVEYQVTISLLGMGASPVENQWGVNDFSVFIVRLSARDLIDACADIRRANASGTKMENSEDTDSLILPKGSHCYTICPETYGFVSDELSEEFRIPLGAVDSISPVGFSEREVLNAVCCADRKRLIKAEWNQLARIDRNHPD